MPGAVDLAVLHEVVRSVMGWTNSHLHEFEIAGRRYGIPDPDFGDNWALVDADPALEWLAWRPLISTS